MQIYSNSQFKREKEKDQVQDNHYQLLNLLFLPENPYFQGSNKSNKVQSQDDHQSPRILYLLLKALQNHRSLQFRRQLLVNKKSIQVNLLLLKIRLEIKVIRNRSLVQEIIQKISLGMKLENHISNKIRLVSREKLQSLPSQQLQQHFNQPKCFHDFTMTSGRNDLQKVFASLQMEIKEAASQADQNHILNMSEIIEQADDGCSSLAQSTLFQQ